MHAKFVTPWLQVVQPLANVHETKWTPHVKRENDVAQSYTSSAETTSHMVCVLFREHNTTACKRVQVSYKAL